MGVQTWIVTGSLKACKIDSGGTWMERSKEGVPGRLQKEHKGRVGKVQEFRLSRKKDCLVLEQKK